MSFKSLRGQGRAVSFLKDVFRSARIASSYMFIGPSGCGKKTAAVEFARLINCSSPVEEEPCGECLFCKNINAMSCPDVKILTKAKDKEELGIDIVLEAVRSIALKPYEAKRKVYIIDGADNMTDEASNAVLKTLEEPPPAALFVLIVENSESILPTIRSRSQAVNFFPLPARELELLLEESYGIDRFKAGLFARLASGSVGRALEYSKGEFLLKRQNVIEAVKGGRFFNSDLDGIKKDAVKSRLEIALSWYRDVLVAKASRGSGRDGVPDIMNIDRLDEIMSCAAKMKFDHLEKAIGGILATINALEKNANSKLAMTSLGANLEERG